VSDGAIHKRLIRVDTCNIRCTWADNIARCFTWIWLSRASSG